MLLVFWTNGVGQLLLGVVGILTHSLLLLILSKQELALTFFRLLVALAIFDNLHYVCSVAMACIHLIPGMTIRETYLPQFHSMFQMTSTYILLALIVERLLALWRIKTLSGVTHGFVIN